MPTYEFICDRCRKVFSMMLSIAKRTSTKVQCPSCRSKKVTPHMTVFTAKTSRKS